MSSLPRLALAFGLAVCLQAQPATPHQHMTQESPRILFLHYWGKGRATDLASAVKAALNAQRTAK